MSGKPSMEPTKQEGGKGKARSQYLTYGKLKRDTLNQHEINCMLRISNGAHIRHLQQNSGFKVLYFRNS